ncbi:MAG: hypothetical protein JO214_18020 [Frankiaceae bacterium]|nr:hypothetical protein [Frankiaceae bacterium]
MSDTDATAPSREELLSIIDELRADRAVGASLVDAARARADQDEAALRDMTGDRDAWRSAAKNLQSELWRQMDMLRSEQTHHRDQIAHLSAAMTALIQIAESRAGAEDVVESEATTAARETLAELPPMPEIPVPTLSSLVAPPPILDHSVIPIADNPLPEPPVVVVAPEPTVETSAPVVAEKAPTPAPFTARAFVPADDSKDVGHLIEKQPSDFPDPPPAPNADRVGIFTELAAVAERVDRPGAAPEPKEAADAETGDAAPHARQVDILPTSEAQTVAKKRPRRLPRLTG